MSTFLRAIRAGAVHIRHGATLLTHYGRMGPAFDVCSKVIVDILREQGMMDDRGEEIVSVITQALQEVGVIAPPILAALPDTISSSKACTLVLDGVVHDESNALQLSKLLATCLVIRGSQLSIVRRLHSQYVIQIHTELLSWIVKRLTIYESNKNKKSFKMGISFFRVLVPLLATIQSRDALKMYVLSVLLFVYHPDFHYSKAHMDQVLAQEKVEIPVTSKTWEPQRAYEKRLTTAMSKENGRSTGRQGKKKDIVNPASVSTDEEATDGEGLTDHERKNPPRAERRSGRLQGANAASPHDQRDVEQTADEEEPEPEPTTPKPRPRPKPTHRQKSPIPSPPAMDDEPQLSANTMPSAVAESALVSGSEVASDALITTPKPSRKRARSGDEGSPSRGITPLGEANPSVEDPNVVPDDGEIQVRRKRVRH